jgi:hypothetical protein
VKSLLFRQVATAIRSMHSRRRCIARSIGEATSTGDQSGVSPEIACYERTGRGPPTEGRSLAHATPCIDRYRNKCIATGNTAAMAKAPSNTLSRAKAPGLTWLIGPSDGDVRLFFIVPSAGVNPTFSRVLAPKMLNRWLIRLCDPTCWLSMAAVLGGGENVKVDRRSTRLPH